MNKKIFLKVEKDRGGKSKIYCNHIHKYHNVLKRMNDSCIIRAHMRVPSDTSPSPQDTSFRIRLEVGEEKNKICGKRSLKSTAL
jgi:hypothetical protein